MREKDPSEIEVIAETAHLRFVRRGGWSYVERTGSSGVVCILAHTSEDKVILVEQYRPPMAGPVIELPAGLAGDLSDAPDEPLLQAALRELLEETGYRAGRLHELPTLASSAGLTNESVTFFMAEDLEKIHDGGGDASEDITVHEVSLVEVDRWLAIRAGQGCLIDAKVYAGLYFLNRSL